MTQKNGESSQKELGSPLCFVIGPIGKIGSAERKHSDLLLHMIIKEVLEDSDFGYRVKRADEDSDPGMIGDRIVQDILNADLVVADLTDLNPNAFYELGIRHSTEKPTIHIARVDTDLPFDNIQHRTIFVDLADWNSIVSARRSLSESTKTVRAPGFKVTNPVTNASSNFKMLQSSDPKDVLLGHLQQRVETVERSLKTMHSRQRNQALPSRADWDRHTSMRFESDQIVAVVDKALEHSPGNVFRAVVDTELRDRGISTAAINIDEDSSGDIERVEITTGNGFTHKLDILGNKVDSWTSRPIS